MNEIIILKLISGSASLPRDRVRRLPLPQGRKTRDKGTAPWKPAFLFSEFVGVAGTDRGREYSRRRRSLEVARGFRRSDHDSVSRDGSPFQSRFGLVASECPPGNLRCRGDSAALQGQETRGNYRWIFSAESFRTSKQTKIKNGGEVWLLGCLRGGLMLVESVQKQFKIVLIFH